MRRAGRLTLWIELDDDALVELGASAVSGAFSGSGAAWFSREELIEFANRLASTYPIPAGERIEIHGGYLVPSGDDSDPIHLLIAISPIGSRGMLGCEIRLADERMYNNIRRFQQRSRMELWTTYEAISRFADELSQLLAGARKDANLDETEH